jgi:FdhD protein
MGAAERPPLAGPSAEVRVLRLARGERPVERRDRVAGEEPLEIRVAGPGEPLAQLAVTMRTPGADFELAVGFLLTEGIIGDRHDIADIRYCEDVGNAEQQYNVLSVRLAVPFDAERLRRNVFASSSCGVCGKASIDMVEVACRPLPPGPVVAFETLLGMPETLRAKQRQFERTGGIHATGLFTPEGRLVELREDIGRHNAMDKAIGARLMDGAGPLHDCVALVSGRAGFELVQKAAVAGIPILAAVGAPSSIAVDAAKRLGVTLVGFLRDDRGNVYSHADRIDAGAA